MKFPKDKVFEFRNSYRDLMNDSFKKGKEINEFINLNDQETRDKNNSQLLVFNHLLTQLTLFKSQSKELEYGVSLTPFSMNNCKQKEQKTFESLFKHLMLDKDNIGAFQKSLDKSLDFGHSVYHIKPVYEKESSLNEILKIECLEDPRSAFFDCHANCPDFSDSSYCGRSYKIKRNKFHQLYPNIKDNTSNDSDVEIIDFWYKVRHKGRYVKLETGEYKREDCVLDWVDEVDRTAKARISYYYDISYARYCDLMDAPLEQIKSIKCPYLPLVFNDCNYIWSYEKKKFLYYPFAWYVKDAQIFINEVGRSLCNMIKNIVADKYFFDEAAICDAGREKIKRINEVQGGIEMRNIAGIRREIAQTIPGELIQLFFEGPNTLQKLLGSFFEGNGAQVKAASGVALDKMFDRSDLIQNNVIIEHLKVVNKVGKVLQFMIPIYYTQQRQLDVKCQTGEIEAIVLNKRDIQPNGEVLTINNVNHIKNINNYHITLTASPRLKKKNFKNELIQLYQLVPQFASISLDKYLQYSDIPDAEILSKRAEFSMPSSVLKYGNGQITYQDVEQEQQQQQQQQQQMAMMQQQPEQQYLKAKAMGEQAKSQTAQYNAETARAKMQQEVKNDQFKLSSDHQKWQADNSVAQDQQRLEYMKTTNERLNHLSQLMESIISNKKEEKSLTN